MQHGGAVGVQYPLGVTGSAGGIAESAGIAFVQLRPVEVFAASGDQGFVTEHVGKPCCRHVGLVGQHHPARHPRAFRRQLLRQRQEIRVEENVAVLGVVDDVDQLLREQARVDGMADVAAAGGTVVGLQMAVIVPGQGTDAVAAGETPVSHGTGQLAGADKRFAVGVAMARVVAGHGYYFLIAIHAFGVAHDLGDQQRHVHHQALHGVLLFLWPIIVPRIVTACPAFAITCSRSRLQGATINAWGHTRAGQWMSIR